MKLQNTSSCINCENLLRDFICKKHNTKVEITNFCESHTYTDSITNKSNCSNCFHFGKTSCSVPGEASQNMLCFDWKTNG